MKKLIEKNVAEIIVLTVLTIVFSSCSSTCDHKLQEMVNTAEIENTAYDMIEWISYDVENGKTDSIIADTYIDNLEQIIKEINNERL